MSGARWHLREGALVTYARNVLTRYALIAGVALLGLIVLPMNLEYLGEEAYGLWVLVAAVTTYFSVLELGYGGALVKFVAEHRARQDAEGLNEVLSTLFFVFCAIAAAVYALALVVSFLLPHIFNLEPEQARTGQLLMLIIGVNVALHFVFSVYGGVINGFELYYLNNIVGAGFHALTALVNILMLVMGFGLVELVAATTATRLVPYWIYRRNAHRVFPELRIRRSSFNRARLRELTGFSAWLAAIDWSSRLLFLTDVFILGIFLTPAAVAIYAVAKKLSDALLRMTLQLHTFLFPAVVRKAIQGGGESQRELLTKATRLQLALALCLCGAVAALADVLIRGWLGPEFTAYAQSARALQMLAVVVVMRAWMGVPGTLLKGTGHHRFLAIVSMCAAVASLLLSIAAVQLVGIVGAAAAIALPTAVKAAALVFPRACREAGLPLARGYREVVWPAVWPAAIVVALLAATRDLLPAGLLPALAAIAAGCLLYGVLFFTRALPREERQWFSSALNQVWRRSFATA